MATAKGKVARRAIHTTPPGRRIPSTRHQVRSRGEPTTPTTQLRGNPRVSSDNDGRVQGRSKRGQVGRDKPRPLLGGGTPEADWWTTTAVTPPHCSVHTLLHAQSGSEPAPPRLGSQGPRSVPAIGHQSASAAESRRLSACACREGTRGAGRGRRA
eukprot:7736293-Alexandrium_andersonii.AAC.1